MNNYRNILIVRTDRIGDVVLTTPAIAAVRAQFPEAKITVLVSSYTRDLVVGNPDLNEVLVDDRKGVHKGVFGFWRLVGDIKRKNFDLALVFHTKRRTNLLCFLAGINNRVGYCDKNFGFLLTTGIPDERHCGQRHESEYCLELLKRMEIRAGHKGLFLPIQPDAEEWINSWLKENDLSDVKIVAIHPGASDPTKCWPLGSFSRLMDQVSQMRDCRVVVLGAGETIGMAKELRKLCSRPFFDLTGKTTVAQTAALLKRCHLLVSNDSGPVHMAAAADIFVISLFLRDQPGINPERWRPLGTKSFVLSNRSQEAVRLDPSGKIVSGAKDSVTVDQVLRLVLDLLQRP